MFRCCSVGAAAVQTIEPSLHTSECEQNWTGIFQRLRDLVIESHLQTHPDPVVTPGQCAVHFDVCFQILFSFLKSPTPLLGILTSFSIAKTRFDVLGLYLKEEDTN